jgi:prevent-host-death family protein
MATTIGIRDLNRHTGDIIRSVATGVHVTVLDRGEPVADIVAHRASSQDAQDERIAALVASGALSMPPRPVTADDTSCHEAFPGGRDLDSVIHGEDRDIW